MNTDTTVGITVGEVKGLRADFEEKLASESGREWVEAFKLFLKRQNPWPEATAQAIESVQKKVVVVQSFLKKLSVFALGALTSKKTADCFLGTRYYYRDGDLDRWLPEVQEATLAGHVVSHELTKPMMFVEMVQSLLGTLEEGVKILSQPLIERGEIFTATQIESLIERTDAGEETGLLTNGYANLFPVLNKDGKTVSVVSALRDAYGRWDVYADRLDFGSCWLAESRFFSRNTGTV